MSAPFRENPTVRRLGIALMILVALVAGYLVTHADTQSTVDTSITAEQLRADQHACADRVDGRNAFNSLVASFRQVIEQAYTPSQPFVFPPDPTVDPAITAYINRVLAARASNADATTAQRDRLLAFLPVLPELTCDAHGVSHALDTPSSTTNNR